MPDLFKIIYPQNLYKFKYKTGLCFFLYIAAYHLSLSLIKYNLAHCHTGPGVESVWWSFRFRWYLPITILL